MHHLLAYRIKGNRNTRVKEHLKRATVIAESLYKKFQIGPYQIRLKHLNWYLNQQIQDLKPASQYRHWLTIRFIVVALDKWDDWQSELHGSWQSPRGEH